MRILPRPALQPSAGRACAKRSRKAFLVHLDLHQNRKGEARRIRNWRRRRLIEVLPTQARTDRLRLKGAWEHGLRALFVTSEVFPHARTGGLGDVSAALPAALRDFGVDMRVLAPGCRQALEQIRSPRVIMRLGDPPGCGEARLLGALLPRSESPVLSVDCARLHDRAGGLVDVVNDASDETIERGAATGFLFDDLSADDLTACVRRALSFYRQPVKRRKLQMNAMRQDFGWRRPAQAYADLYRSLTNPSVVEADTGSRNTKKRPRELRRKSGRRASRALGGAAKGG